MKIRNLIIILLLALVGILTQNVQAQTLLSKRDSKKAVKFLYKKLQKQEYRTAITNYDYYEQIDREKLPKRFKNKLTKIDSELPAQKQIFENNKLQVEQAVASFKEAKITREYDNFLVLNLNKNNAFDETISKYTQYVYDTIEAAKDIKVSMNLLKFIKTNTGDSPGTIKYYNHMLDHHKFSDLSYFPIYKKDKKFYTKVVYKHLLFLAKTNENSIEELLKLHKAGKYNEVFPLLFMSSSYAIIMEEDTTKILDWIKQNSASFHDYKNVLSAKYKKPVENMMADLRQRKANEIQTLLAKVDLLIKKGGAKNMAEAQKLLLLCSTQQTPYLNETQKQAVISNMQQVALAHHKSYGGGSGSPLKIKSLEDVTKIGGALYTVGKGAVKVGSGTLKVLKSINSFSSFF